MDKSFRKLKPFLHELEAKRLQSLLEKEARWQFVPQTIHGDIDNGDDHPNT